MKVIGLTRVRNESEIMKETLDHMSEFCTGGVYVYDDASTDNTVEICENHHICRGIVKGTEWDNNRETAEYENRDAVLRLARENGNLSPDDWFIYMDADERIDFDFDVLEILPTSVGGIVMRLFDFYITKEDVNKHYSERRWIGPEYRDILFMFKNKNAIGYSIPDQRECTIRDCGVVLSGYVKHFGKSISVDQWEETCEYYATHFPKYSAKWNARRGKAIHNKSDFDRDLMLWDDRGNKDLIVKLH